MRSALTELIGRCGWVFSRASSPGFPLKSLQPSRLAELVNVGGIRVEPFSFYDLPRSLRRVLTWCPWRS